VLYNRLNTQGCKEYEEDYQIVSGIAEDIRDAILEYQVRDDTPHSTVGQLKLVCFDRSPSNAQYIIIIAS